MPFEFIDLKPMSTLVLKFLYGKEPMKATEIADQLNLKTRQVDACITKSLVRYGFAVREAKLTRLMKKDYNLIKITDRGNQYIEWLQQRTF